MTDYEKSTLRITVTNKIESRINNITPRTAALMFWVGVLMVFSIEKTLPGEVIESTSYAIGVKVILNLLVAFWVYVDATSREWEKERITLYSIFSVTFTEITIPIYIVKSRGWKEAGKSVLRFLLYLFCILILITFISSFGKR